MHGSFAKAQLSRDLQQHPACFTPEPEPTQRERLLALWKSALDAGHYAVRNANVEVLGGPCVTSDETSVDVTLGCAIGSEREVSVMLRAMASAWEMGLKDLR